MKRIVQIERGHVSLMELGEGVTVTPIQNATHLEVTDDSTWDDLRKRIRTGKLDHATVKQMLDIKQDNMSK